MQVTRIAKVSCPRCGKTLTAHQGQPDVECDCHLYCSHGSKPSDCTLVAASSGNDAFTGHWKWPSGLHNKDSHEVDDTQARTYWCSTHSVYSTKVPMLVSVDWDKWYSKRAPSKFRFSHGKY